MSAPKDQHFLIDRNAVRRIADLVDLRDRLVLEIGPGEGILTGELLSRGAKVNAVEIDPDLVDELVRKELGLTQPDEVIIPLD